MASTSTSSRCRTRSRRSTPPSCAGCAQARAGRRRLVSHVAATGGAASWNEGYELVDNGDANSHSLVSPGGANAIMVMAYDFNWSGSARAGGVAPIDSPYILDSAKRCRPTWRVSPRPAHLGRAVLRSLLDNDQLGVEWCTCANAGGCQAASWASAYVDARSAAADHGRRWDSVGKVPWYRSSAHLRHVRAGVLRRLRSLEVKYEQVKTHDLRGVGIWHLLMDGSRTELWNRLRGVQAPALHRHRRHTVRGRDRLARRHGHHHRLRADPVLPPRPGHPRSDGDVPGARAGPAGDLNRLLR